jgi:hypothetical protein
MGWLFLGMPWSKYTCTQCGSVLAGTFLRLALISVSTGFLGYALFGAIKGNVNPLLLPPALALTLVILFLNLPMQIKKVSDDGSTDT